MFTFDAKSLIKIVSVNFTGTLILDKIFSNDVKTFNGLTEGQLNDYCCKHAKKQFFKTKLAI